MAPEPSQSAPDLEGRDLSAGLGHLKMAKDSVEALARQALRSKDLRTVLGAIDALTEFGRELRLRSDDLHAHAYGLMGKEKKIDLGVGFGVVERSTSASTKWDDPAILAQLPKHVAQAVNPETGQILPDGEELAKLIMECCQVSYWRKGKLRELGLDPDEYSETSWGARRIRRISGGRRAVHRGKFQKPGDDSATEGG